MQAYDPDSTIHVLSVGNPKRKNSQAAARFALYRHGMTVKDFLSAGGTVADLRWDRQRHFIRIIQRDLDAERDLRERALNLE